MNTKIHTILFGIVAIVALALTACQPKVVTQEVVVTKEVQVEKKVEVTKVVEVAPEKQSTMDRIKEEGVVVVGVANEFPYGYIDTENDNQLKGVSPDIVRDALKVIFGEDVVMEPVVTEFGALIPGLNAGRFDIVTAGMYITPKRCEAVAFGNPDYTIVDGLIVAEGNPYDLHSYADIAANPEVRASTGNGYAEHDKMLNAGVSEDQITLFPDDVSGAAGVQAGQVDVYTGTAPTVNGILADLGPGSGIEIASNFVDTAPNFGGAVFRKEDADFVDAYNAALEQLKADGTLAGIHAEYPGFGDFTLPGDAVLSDICP